MRGKPQISPRQEILADSGASLATSSPGRGGITDNRGSTWLVAGCRRRCTRFRRRGHLYPYSGVALDHRMMVSIGTPEATNVRGPNQRPNHVALRHRRARSVGPTSSIRDANLVWHTTGAPGRPLAGSLRGLVTPRGASWIAQMARFRDRGCCPGRVLPGRLSRRAAQVCPGVRGDGA
jgi:hypothetical protein